MINSVLMVGTSARLRAEHDVYSLYTSEDANEHLGIRHR